VVISLCDRLGIVHTLALPLVLQAVSFALIQAKSEIWNSDQGNQFTSRRYVEKLLAAEVQVAWMARHARWTTS
jgi:transposase InsO family protein